MSLSAGLLLMVAFSLNAAANILLKVAAQKGAFSGSLSLVAILQHYWLAGLGLVCFALNTIFYFLAFRQLPLSVAYPTMVVASLVLVGFVAVTVLAERLTIVQVVGYAIMIIGLVIIFAFAARS